MSGKPEPADPPRIAYRAAEVAELTGVDYDTVRKLVRVGEIPRLTLGDKLVLIPAWALRSWAATGVWDHPDWRPVPPAPLEATA